MTIANAYTRFFAPNPSYKNNNPPFTKGQNIFGRALQHWEEGAQHGENRSDAAKKIEDAWWKDDLFSELDLVGMKLTSLPNCITGIDNLRELDLSGNSLEQLPDLSKLQTKEGKQCALQTLNLVGNPLSQLPDLRNIHSLQELHVTRDVLKRMQAEQLLPPQLRSVIVKEPSDIPLPPRRSVLPPLSQIPRRSDSASTPSLPNSVVKQSDAQEKNLNTPSQPPSEQIEEPKKSDAPTKASIDEIVAKDEDMLSRDDNIPTQRPEPPKDTPLLNTQPTHADLKRELEEGRRGFSKKNAALGNLKGREAIAHIRKHGTFGELINQVTRSGLKGFANQFGRKKKMADAVAGTANNNPLPPIPIEHPNTATDIPFPNNTNTPTPEPQSPVRLSLDKSSKKINSDLDPNNSQKPIEMNCFPCTPTRPCSSWSGEPRSSIELLIPKSISEPSNAYPKINAFISPSDPVIGQQLPSLNASPPQKNKKDDVNDRDAPNGTTRFLHQQNSAGIRSMASVPLIQLTYPQGLSEDGKAAYDFFTKPDVAHSRENPRSFNQVMNYGSGVEAFGQVESRLKDTLETDHFFIQWLFPIDSQSRPNPTAPVLSKEDIRTLRNSPEFKEMLGQGFNKMLAFYGLKWNTKLQCITALDPMPITSQMAWIDNKKNHNNMRLTRIIRSMTLFGFNQQAIALNGFLKENVRDDASRITHTETRHQHWEKALELPSNNGSSFTIRKVPQPTSRNTATSPASQRSAAEVLSFNRRVPQPASSAVQYLLHKDEQQTHPRVGPKSNSDPTLETKFTTSPTIASTIEYLANPKKIMTVVPGQRELAGKPVPNAKNMKFSSALAKDDSKNNNNAEYTTASDQRIQKLREIKKATIPEKNTPDGRLRAGVIIRLPDGRVVVTESNNHYNLGGSFPMGGAGKNHGGVDPSRHLEIAAIKEAYEESGLRVKLDGHLGDFKVFDRYSNRERREIHNTYRIFVGSLDPDENGEVGNPENMDWEVQSVSFVPEDQIGAFLKSINGKPHVGYGGPLSTTERQYQERRGNDFLKAVTVYQRYRAVETDAENKFESARSRLVDEMTLINPLNQLDLRYTSPLSDALRNEAIARRQGKVLPKEELTPHVDEHDYNGALRETAIKLHGSNKHIHANKIDFELSKPSAHFIASQVPHPDSHKEFWQAMHQEEVSVIVDLTQAEHVVKDVTTHDRKITKAYSPNDATNKKNYEGIELIKTKSSTQYIENIDDKKVVTQHKLLIDTLTLKKNNIPKDITRLHYLDWVDRETIGTQALITFADQVNEIVKAKATAHGFTPKVLIHCRSGVGRTGTLMAFMAASEHVEAFLKNNNNAINNAQLLDIVIDVVRTGRLSRGIYFVGNKQFAFLIQALREKYQINLPQVAAEVATSPTLNPGTLG